MLADVINSEIRQILNRGEPAAYVGVQSTSADLKRTKNMGILYESSRSSACMQCNASSTRTQKSDLQETFPRLMDVRLLSVSR